MLPPKDAAAAIGWRALPLLRNELLHWRARGMALELPSLIVKAFECAELFRAPQFCFLDRRFQHRMV